MRIVLRVLATVVGVVGLLVVAVGVAGAVVVGPADTISLREQRVASSGVAVVTSPGLLSVFGPTLHVKAAVDPQAGPVFVGIARDVDTGDYLRSLRRTEITSVRWPGSLALNELSGEARAAAPARLDFWVARHQGDTVAEVAWPMRDGHYSAAVMRADGKAAVDAGVSVGLQIDGLFRTALLLAAAGAGAVAMSVLAWVLTRPRKAVVR